MLKIKIAELKREDVSKEIAEKYFKSPWGQSIDRMYIAPVDEESYNEYIAKAMTNPKKYGVSRISEDNKCFSTASQYYKDKIALAKVAEDFKVSPNYISLENYVKAPSFYEHYDTGMQIAYECIPYNTPSLHEVIDRTFKKEETVLSEELFEQLYAFCYTAITSFKAMMLIKIEKTIGLLNQAIDESVGFTKNVSLKTQKALESHFKFYKTLLEDKDVKDWIHSTNDVEIYAKSEHSMQFIETYIKLFKDIGLDFTETEEFQAFCPADAGDLIEIDFRSFGF